MSCQSLQKSRGGSRLLDLRAPTRRDPYRIVYRILQDQHVVRVARIEHGAGAFAQVNRESRGPTSCWPLPSLSRSGDAGAKRRYRLVVIHKRSRVANPFAVC